MLVMTSKLETGFVFSFLAFFLLGSFSHKLPSLLFFPFKSHSPRRGFTIASKCRKSLMIKDSCESFDSVTIVIIFSLFMLRNSIIIFGSIFPSSRSLHSGPKVQYLANKETGQQLFTLQKIFH